MNSESMISQTGRQMDYCTQYASILRAQQRFVNFCSNFIKKIGVQSQLRHFKRLLTHSFVSGKKSAVIIFRLESQIFNWLMMKMTLFLSLKHLRVQSKKSCKKSLNRSLAQLSFCCYSAFGPGNHYFTFQSSKAIKHIG